MLKKNSPKKCYQLFLTLQKINYKNVTAIDYSVLSIFIGC